MEFLSVINAHDETIYIRSALRSAWQAAALLERSHGVSSQILVVMDRPDGDLRSAVATIVDEHTSGTEVIEVDFGDLAMSRNFAVSKATPECFVAFLDADDLWGSSWLKKSWEVLQEIENPSQVILHPQINYFFGQGMTRKTTTVFEHISSEDASFDPFNLAAVNHWTALSLAKASVYQRVPYGSNQAESGIGFEDWGFNLETLSLGMQHHVVEETVHFIRQKGGASMKSTFASLDRRPRVSNVWF